LKQTIAFLGILIDEGLEDHVNVFLTSKRVKSSLFGLPLRKVPVGEGRAMVGDHLEVGARSVARQQN